jgi:hypothetical protein
MSLNQCPSLYSASRHVLLYVPQLGVCHQQTSRKGNTRRCFFASLVHAASPRVAASAGLLCIPCARDWAEGNGVSIACCTRFWGLEMHRNGAFRLGWACAVLTQSDRGKDAERISTWTNVTTCPDIELGNKRLFETPRVAAGPVPFPARGWSLRPKLIPDRATAAIPSTSLSLPAVR